jgi:hypothetical protein
VADQIEQLNLDALRAVCASGEARALRLAFGASLHDVAVALGTSKSCLHNWETGAAQPTGGKWPEYAILIEEWRRLADDLALEVPRS